MVHICFAIHDEKGTYIKNLGVAICSVLENTTTKVQIHLLHDKTLCEDNKKKLENFVNQYCATINFYEVNVSQFDYYKNMTGNFTIGTLFRIEIAKLLPLTVSKVIYLDSDIVANIDLYCLWHVDISDYMLAGCLDMEISKRGNTWSCEHHIVKAKEYINAGVLLLNIKKIRENFDLEEECFRFLKEYSSCELSDQDAFNYVFRKSKLVLNEKYNLFTKVYKNKMLQQGIYHYAGDIVNFEEPQMIDEMFMECLLKTPWGGITELLNMYKNTMLNKRCQVEFYQNAIKLIQQKEKKIIWGVNSIMFPFIIDFIKFDKEKDYMVDTNDQLVGKSISGLTVYEPKNVLHEKGGNVLIIVLSINYYNDISNILRKYGFKENYDYIDGRRFLLQSQGGYIV